MTAPASPYTGKVLMLKNDAWHHDVSPSSRQQRLESLTTALRRLVDAGLGAASIIATSTTSGLSPSWRGNSASLR
jgi:hypothetical protein